MGKIVNQVTTQIVDGQTGELVNETQKISYIEKTQKDPFFLTYSKHMSLLYKLTRLATIKVLWKFLELSDYNTNKVVLSTQAKQEIIKDLQISLPTYNVALRELKDVGLITGGKGTFYINEEVHWKGTYETREALKRAKLKITFEPSFD